MKKQSTLNFKILFSAMALNFISGNIYAAGFLPLPKDAKEPSGSVKDALYGPEIESCQVASGGWAKSEPDFENYAKYEMGQAAEKFNDSLKDSAPKLADFLGSGTKLSDFIDFKDGTVKDPYVTFEGIIGGIKTAFILDSKYLKDTENNTCINNSNLLTNNCIRAKEIAHLPDVNHYIEEKEVKNFIEDELGQAVSTYQKSLTKIVDKFAKCSALYVVVSGAKNNRDMDISEFNKTQSDKSYDGALSCSSMGYETQDYKACKKSIGFYDTVFIGRQAVEAVQSLQYTDSSMDIQTEFAQNSQTDATAGLKAQQQDIQTQANMARTRVATEAAATAALYASMQDMPTLEGLTNECVQKMPSFSQKETVTKFANYYSKYYEDTIIDKIGQTRNDGFTTSQYIQESLESACEIYVGNIQSSSHALIQNGNARQVIEQALVNAGMNIATNLGTAAILDKQAGRVGDAIKLVDEYDPESLAYDSEDLLTTECAVDPSSENCVNAVYERGVGYQNDGISVNGMQFATSDSTLPIDEYSRSTDGASDPTDTSTSVGAIGSPINSIDKGTGLADSPLAAASVSSTGANGLGSGRGGGGGGGGGASAPANGSASTGGQGAPSAYTGSSKKLSYSSGGGGLSFSSGSTRTAKKAKATNPFSSLFGKKTAKTEGVLNFRGVASEVGSKNGSIFQMISKRYSAVSKDERLEEYQKVNE